MLTNKGQSSALEILIIVLGCISILLIVGIFSGQKSIESLEQSKTSLYARRILDVMMRYEYEGTPLQDLLSIYLCDSSNQLNYQIEPILEMQLKEIGDYYSEKKDFNYVLWTTNGEITLCDNNTDCENKIIISDVIEVDYELSLPCNKESSLKLGVWNYR